MSLANEKQVNRCRSSSPISIELNRLLKKKHSNRMDDSVVKALEEWVWVGEGQWEKKPGGGG